MNDKESLLMEINRGPKKEKERLRLVMAQECMIVAGSGWAYADDREDTLLATKLDFTKGDLLHLVDSERANKAEMVYNVMLPIVADLDVYNITALILTKLRDSVTGYRAFLTAPKNNADAGAGLHGELEVHIGNCIKLLKKLDRLMEHFKEHHNEFVTIYFKSRAIVDLGHRYRKAICDVSGIIGSLGTTDLVDGVSVFILGDEKHGVVSDGGGYYKLCSYRDGEVVLVFEKDGFGRKGVHLLIVKKENQEINIELKADEASAKE